jgi:hypothetical protein
MADLTNFPELTDEMLQKFIGHALQQATKEDTRSPLSSGLLTAGLAMMAGSRGRSFGEALGQGGLLGLQAYGAQKELAKKDPTQMISLLNSIEDLKANREMGQLFKGLGPQTSGSPQFQPAPGLPTDTPQQLRGMFNRGDIDLSPNAVTGKPVPPAEQSGLYGSMVTPPPTFTGNVPSVERLYPLLARPKTSAAAQNLAEILGYKPQTVAPGATVMVGGKPTYTAPNVGEGQTVDAAGNAAFINNYLQNIEAIKKATARGTKSGELPFEPPTPVPTGRPGETQLMSREGQIAIGNRNAAPFLQPPTQQPAQPAGLPATPEMQDFLAQNGVPNRIDPNTGQLVIGKAADAYSRPEASQRPLGPLGVPAQPTPQGPPPRMGVDPGKVAEAVATKTGEAPIAIQQSAQTGANTDFITNEFRPTMAQGQQAVKSIAGLDVLDNLPNTKTGWGMTGPVYGARVLEGLGMAPQAAKDLATNATIFHKTVQSEVNRKLMEAKGVQTEGDAQRAALLYSQLTDTNTANQFTRDIARAQHNQEVAKAKFYSSGYTDALKGGDPYVLEAKWREQQKSIFDDPVMKKWAIKEAPAKEKSGEMVSTGAPPPGAVVDGFQFKGGNPNDKKNWVKQ